MKSILLTTTALVAFAGAAAADGHAGVSFSGSATLGYNDTNNPADGDDNIGFYSDMELDVSMVAALDNGITVTATADINDLDAANSDFAGVTLEIASESAKLIVGDTNSSADTHWAGVDGDTVGDFRGETTHLANFDSVIRGEATFGAVTGSVSYGLNYDDNDSDTALNALQVAAVADVAGFTVVGAYEEEIAPTAALSQQFGISVSGAVAGFDVTGAYSSREINSTTSLGINVSAPFGPVTVGGYYSLNDSDVAAEALDAYGLDIAYADGPITIAADVDMVEDDDATWEIDANYEVMEGAIIHAGVVDSGEDFYVAGTYDLGGGASLLVSYVEDGDEDNGDDEIGEDDLQAGVTVEVSFSF